MPKVLSDPKPRGAPLPSRKSGPVEKRFLELASRWEEKTLLISSSTEIANHPAYREIISLGAPAIPYILNDLKVSDSHWHAALQAISGENPVPPEDMGKIKKMNDAWLAWGGEQRY